MFDRWYKLEFGVNPSEVVRDSAAFYQLQLARRVWEVAYEQGALAEAEYRDYEKEYYD